MPASVAQNSNPRSTWYAMARLREPALQCGIVHLGHDMVIEVGLVTAIQDWVGEPASQQPAGQGLVTQVRTLELGGETEEELPEIDVGEWSPDGDTFLCG